jgi:hypothetical protein
LVAAINGQAQNYHHTDILDTGLNSPLLDLLNARYVIVPARQASDQILPNVTRSFSTVYADDNVRVLENRAALPRAWLVHSVVQGTLAEAAADLARGDIDPRQTAVLEEPPPPLVQPVDPAREGVELLVYAPNVITLRTHSTAAALLVLSEVYYPAWQAFIDGRPAHVYAADTALRSVGVPAGDHQIEFRYISSALTGGLIVSGLAALALCLLLVDQVQWLRSTWPHTRPNVDCS